MRTHRKKPWCWETLKAGGEGDDRGWDGWMESLMWWTWTWIGSRSWWWPGSLMCFSPWGCKESDTTEWLNWPELKRWWYQRQGYGCLNEEKCWNLEILWRLNRVVWWILKSLLQQHCSKASILWRSAFFIVQLSYPYMTTGKTIALTRRTFVDKVMSLLFNMLSSLVITFLPRSNDLLISWLQSPSAVILEPPKIKSATVSTVSPSICHEVM